MRIGQFSDSFYPIVDGVGRVVYNYATTMCHAGHECYVIAPMTDIGYLGQFPFELLEFVSVNVPTQNQYQTGIPVLDVHYMQRIRKIPLDIIHAHSPFIAGQEAVRIAKRNNIPLVGTFHSRYYDDFYQLTKAEMLADIGVRMVVSFYEHCDEVWTVSHSSAETLHDYGYKGDIVVIPNGTPVPDPSRKNMQEAADLFHLGNDPVLMYCGQMNWKKNIRLILESASLLLKRGYTFQLVMVGQGPDANEIRSFSESLSLGNRVVFTGHLREDRLINGIYQKACLFVFPSLYDTSGMVVREAAAMGTASVVLRGSAAGEDIRDGENGLLCENTPESLADTIQKVLDDPALGARLGRSAADTIFLPWEDVVDSVLSRYENLIEKKRNTPRDHQSV